LTSLANWFVTGSEALRVAALWAILIVGAIGVVVVWLIRRRR
jgi:hypothetical protein